MVLWLSVQSLSLQVECRTALIHYLFFSDGGKAHRKLIAGPKFDQKAWGKDPLLVANGPNTTWKLILWMEGQKVAISQWFLALSPRRGDLTRLAPTTLCLESVRMQPSGLRVPKSWRRCR